MKIAELFKQYLEHLFAGKRCEAREMILAAQDRGICASKLLQKVIWPAMEQIEKLYREDHISRVVEQMATRINRMLADQLQGLLARKPKNGQRMIVLCGEGESEELGAQMTADLFEAEGWHIWFIGSGVPNDEILQLIGKLKPDILCIYGAEPVGVPAIRGLVHLIREVGVCEEMQTLVVGGVFNRAEGLAEEIKSDLFARNVTEAVATVQEHPVRIPKPDVPEPGRRRKRKRKTSSAALRKARVALGA
ncbi:MAG: hypothetical protein KAU28_11145 [Phycisphaerae bacterium]|nr:hypothetical protein [Phycisphaerae bacterium]